MRAVTAYPPKQRGTAYVETAIGVQAYAVDAERAR